MALTKKEYDALRYRQKHPLVEKEYKCETCNSVFWSNLKRAKYCSYSCKNTGGSRKHHQRHNGTLEYCLKKLCGEPSRKDLNWKDVYSLYLEQEGRCALSGVLLTYDRTSKTTALSIDRIIPGGPYILENIRLVCGIVNTMRSNMQDEELLYWCDRLINYANSRDS